MRVVIWGTGRCFENIFKMVREQPVKIVGIVDNDSSKWGEKIADFTVMPPDSIKKLAYDGIIITSEKYYDEIREQLINFYNIPFEQIGDWSYSFTKNVLDYYNKNPKEVKEDMLEPLSRIKLENKIRVFNYGFAQNFKSKICVEFDEKARLFYAIYYGKRMYLSRRYDSIEKARKYCIGLLMEQYPESPHVYLNDKFYVEKDSQVLDAGAAEGNFALSVIDKVSHIVMVEADEEWLEPLMYTFELYKNKVTIINKYLTDYNDSKNITIDSIAKNLQVDFIKMDIEGAEPKALDGGADYLSARNNIKLAVCAYHNLNDEKLITEKLEKYGFKTHTSEGYMNFLWTKSEPKLFVRGIVRGEKKENQKRS